MGTTRGAPDARRRARRVRAGGPGKRAGGDTGTAPRADLTTRQEETQRRAAAGLPPKTRKRRRKTLAGLAAGPP